MKKVMIATLVMIISIVLFISCKYERDFIAIGKYYLNDKSDSPYIYVINETEIALINFDIDEILEIYDIEDTEATGNNIEAALKGNLVYTVAQDGNMLIMYANVTGVSGLRIPYNTKTKQLELFDEVYTWSSLE